MKNSKQIVTVLMLVIAALACGLPTSSGGDLDVEGTRVALAVQQTSLAIQQATLNAALSVAPTYTPYPTYTPDAGAANVVEVTATEAQAPVDMDARIKASNILVYEDVIGDPALVPIVSNVVSGMNFSGGRVINTGDAMGDFRDQINSATQWDLVIVAGEVRSGFSGELFEILYDHIDNGGAVIIEMWYLDDVSEGKIAPILSECGVQFSRDWWRDADYDPYRYSIYWLDKSHPLLSTPNIAQPPSYPYPEWFGDAGDLLELAPGGDAILVGGLYPNRTSDYGVLASCMDGRMVLQTFSTHDYKAETTRALWENYITYTLTKHYEFLK
ncbi:hypothetical protein MASR2M66_10470 [Chloroflexota bacterium]